MGLFDYGTLTQERQAEAAKIPEEVLAETINLNIPEGVEELAALLTFIQKRRGLLLFKVLLALCW